MNATRTAPVRQSLAALAMAATMTLGLLSAVGLIADSYHADEAVAQGAATPGAQQLVAAASSKRS
jgi:hypothetical protein